MPTRRTFLCAAAAAPLAAALRPARAAAPLPLAVNQYTPDTLYAREGRRWMAAPAADLRVLAAAGLTGYEPSFGSVAEVEALAPHVPGSGLAIRSCYVNTTLHDAATAEASIAAAQAIARAAKRLGVQVIVTNPSPISWESAEDKTDAQLEVQAAALGRLGALLHADGLTLAYHTHAPELRAAARELHHMLLATDPQHVRFCLDAHWCYRGSGNSQVALRDIARMYAPRIAAVHLRQSAAGVWTEVFGPGDVDYARLAAIVAPQRPLLVLEQAPEEGTPRTLGAAEVLRRSAEAVCAVWPA